MLRVALTGGIATGKSYCTAAFARMNVPVIDADVLAREAVAPGTRGLEAIAARFGSDLIRTDGDLDRAALGAIVFSDAKARADLEAIVHPDVYRRIREWFANLPAGPRFAIADIPLLFETGQQHDFDAVVVCACAPSEQLRRIIARNNLSEGDARARIAAQLPIDEKVARADHVIWTDGGYAETEAQVRTVFELLNAL
jgi:dephospho-CoA kinase